MVKPMISHPLDEISEAIGRRLRLARRARAMTLRDVADGIGVTFQQLQKYETGECVVSAQRLWDLSQKLEVPIGQLLPPLPGRTLG